MEQTLVSTRRSLHAVAETLMAGHQHRVAGTIRLAVTPGGFATGPLPGDPSLLSVRGTDLVVVGRAGEEAVALAGTLGELAVAAGVEFGAPEDVYGEGTGAQADDRVVVDPSSAATIGGALASGDAALRRLAAAHAPDAPPAPVLWPEHFDVGISLDEVNYGISAGDGAIAEPYAYVGPWQPRTGDFWDRPFGAARTVRELGDVDAMVEFFEAGRRRAELDPKA
ncbi:MAG: hypothetical protein ACXV3C_10525 [Actinomycetes bacterium]